MTSNRPYFLVPTANNARLVKPPISDLRNTPGPSTLPASKPPIEASSAASLSLDDPSRADDAPPRNQTPFTASCKWNGCGMKFRTDYGNTGRHLIHCHGLPMDAGNKSIHCRWDNCNGFQPADVSGIVRHIRDHHLGLGERHCLVCGTPVCKEHEMLHVGWNHGDVVRVCRG